ncbi:Stk1 family PASTA domain-containing Ser/Thr kinase [Streptomyces sp. NPDC060194]|uniref:Stk1 family PASTA domain-containing Ser/Thr kinase n=1 Tax=Streptomyces sp. NPDC060194 TaxID=3347069 RepID=UPI0036671303
MEEPRRLGGRYELGSVLGRGGMAEVYLAHDTRLGRTVAVKTLRVDLARDPSFQARFRREAQSAASLNHPAIVAVYDTGEDMVYDSASGNGASISIPYIVMEYVDGSTLRELLHSGRKLLPERSMEMTIGILQALEYSHRNGIVHRDIKPANVMLTRTGQVKVMDFGIARAMGDSGMTMTQTAAVIGTAQYLSPEQAKGEQVDARSDLYSTGCLLYELLTVRPPFVGDSPVAVAYQHVREEPQPPSNFDHEITSEMDAIVLKALTKDPDYRYQSADDMRLDIEALLDGRPVAATAAMGSVGYGSYDSDQSTAPLRAQSGGSSVDQTSMLPPIPPNEGGYGYGSDDGGGRRRQPQRKSNTSTIMLVVAGALVLAGIVALSMWAFANNDGKDTVNVPSLVGKTERAAEQATTNSQLKLVVTSRGECAVEGIEKGQVCTQDPEGGKLAKNEPVNVTISTGEPKIEVPDVTEKSEDNATEILEDKGFDVSVDKVESDTVPEGNIISQSPKGGSKAEEGAEVSLKVSAGESQKTIPNVLNQPFEAAQAQLVQNGFVVARTDEETDDPNLVNKVIKQNPSGKAAEGTQITLTIGKAKEVKKVAVPAFAPLTTSLKDAKAALEQAGLKPGNIEGPQDDNALVVAQDPGGNSQVDEGSAVNLRTVPAPGGNIGDGSGLIGGNDGDNNGGNGDGRNNGRRDD